MEENVFNCGSTSTNRLNNIPYHHKKNYLVTEPNPIDMQSGPNIRLPIPCNIQFTAHEHGYLSEILIKLWKANIVIRMH